MINGRRDENAIVLQLRARGIDAYIWEDPPGAFYPPHEHPTPEHRWMIAGALRIVFASGETRILEPGDKLRVPPGALHWAQAGAAGARYVCWSEDGGAPDGAAKRASSSPGP